MARGKFLTLDVFRAKNAAYYVVQLKIKKQNKQSRVTVLKYKIYIDLWTEIKGTPYITFLPPSNVPNLDEQAPRYCGCEHHYGPHSEETSFIEN